WHLRRAVPDDDDDDSTRAVLHAEHTGWTLRPVQHPGSLPMQPARRCFSARAPSDLHTKSLRNHHHLHHLHDHQLHDHHHLRHDQDPPRLDAAPAVTPPCTFVTTWGSSGSGDGQFSFPEGVATDGSGNVYVADTGNDRIQKFDASGTFLSTWGSFGSGDGQ